eukprot:m.490124 g.490124  ORF g.490124 m.490124 type:complete len:320 (+) comp57246_c0_seq1:97-1056(+)
MAVRSKQITGLQTVLAPADPTNPQWKVLVYDNAGRDILSPILSQAALRDLSVVAHFSISAVRTRIPDAPAVYFVMPTEANIRRICQDCESDLYGSFELNFISELPRKLLELLAATAATAEADPPIIAKVFDVYSNFISLEENLFVMSQQQRSLMSYGALNNPGAQDTEIEQMMKDIVDSLFSVLVTMSVVPIIRCSRRNAAEDIARRLDQKLRDNLANSKTSLFANSLDGLAQYLLSLSFCCCCVGSRIPSSAYFPSPCIRSVPIPWFHCAPFLSVWWWLRAAFSVLFLCCWTATLTFLSSCTTHGHTRPSCTIFWTSS